MTVIAITAGAMEQPRVINAYVGAVVRAGGTPVILPTALDDDCHVDAIVDRVDALLLSGGGDIHPQEYGEPVRVTLDAVDHRRDRVERRAVQLAMAYGKRVLGVCRGAQLLAVATGGTLIQDLALEGHHGHIDHHHDRGYATLQHGVKAEVGSLAERSLDRRSDINSHHHQAIRHVGDVLHATAWADDGVIEAVEGPGLLGLQWHPETLIINDNRHRGPFHWLVDGK
jgi:putative glutamine amidotransferase